MCNFPLYYPHNKGNVRLKMHLCPKLSVGDANILMLASKEDPEYQGPRFIMIRFIEAFKPPIEWVEITKRSWAHFTHMV